MTKEELIQKANEEGQRVADNFVKQIEGVMDKDPLTALIVVTKFHSILKDLLFLSSAPDPYNKIIMHTLQECVTSIMTTVERFDKEVKNDVSTD